MTTAGPRSQSGSVSFCKIRETNSSKLVRIAQSSLDQKGNMITINYLQDRAEGVLLCSMKVAQKRAEPWELRAKVSHGPPEVGEALDTTWTQKRERRTVFAAQKSWLVDKATSPGTQGLYFRTAGSKFLCHGSNAPKLYWPNSCCADLNTIDNSCTEAMDRHTKETQKRTWPKYF